MTSGQGGGGLDKNRTRTEQNRTEQEQNRTEQNRTRTGGGALDGSSHDRPRPGPAVGPVQEDPGAGCRLLLVLLPLQARSCPLHPGPPSLTQPQRRPPRPAGGPAHLVAPLVEAHGLADGARHAALPLRRPQLRQARRPRVPRTARRALLALLLPRHMGHHGPRRGLLVGHEDQAQGPA